jgi:hypothetical protein
MTFNKQYTENDILNALTDKPANPAVVARRAGCSVTTCKRMLNDLCNKGKVDRTEIETLDGISYVWRKQV